MLAPWSLDQTILHWQLQFFFGLLKQYVAVRAA
jgi:hypothetical protein